MFTSTEKAELSERPKEALVHPESNGMKASTHQELSEKDVVKVLLGFEVKQVKGFYFVLFL